MQIKGEDVPLCFQITILFRMISGMSSLFEEDR